MNVNPLQKPKKKKITWHKLEGEVSLKIFSLIIYILPD